MRPVVLCFSGLDPSGGAGLQADIETIAALGGHAAVICTALTVQDSQRVHGFVAVDAALQRQQAEAVLADLPVAAIKLGMLATAATAAMVAAILRAHPALPVVLDPVLAANSGAPLAGEELRAALLELLPLTTVITPNTPELYRLAGGEPGQDAVRVLGALGARQILLTGGHEPGEILVNRLFDATVQELYRSERPRLAGEFHGSGCTLASAIATGLAAGLPLVAAVQQAEAFVATALARADRPRAAGQYLPRRVRPC